jgi:signal transduction protein with GAF and PtsI domain
MFPLSRVNTPLTALMQSSAALAASSPPEGEIGTVKPFQDLQEAINLLANITEAFTAALFLKEPGGDVLRPAVWHTLSRSFRSHEDVQPGEGLVGYVFKHHAIADVDRYQQQATATRLYDRDEGIQAFLALPVGNQGVLVVDTRTRKAFGEREKKIVRNFADFMAHLAIHHQTLRREAMYGRIIDLIYDVENAALRYVNDRQFISGILQAGFKFTGLNMGFFCVTLPGRNQYLVQGVEGPYVRPLQGRTFPVGQGLMGWIFKERRTLAHCRVRPLKGKSYLIFPEEPMRDYNAFIGAPLMAWRRLSGVIAFAGHTERALDQEEEQALQLAGHRVAATMEHFSN